MSVCSLFAISSVSFAFFEHFAPFNSFQMCLYYVHCKLIRLNIFFCACREALCAWQSKANCNVVPAERLHELFEELGLNPTEKQSNRHSKAHRVCSLAAHLPVSPLTVDCILVLVTTVNEMLQTAKLFARSGNGGLDARCSSLAKSQMNGLTFGEFSVLAADIRRFRTQCLQPSTSAPQNRPDHDGQPSKAAATAAAAAEENVKQTLKPADPNAPEVFLGGSCNPTTWRADVAIPTLDRLGISFFNPVSGVERCWGALQNYAKFVAKLCQTMQNYAKLCKFEPSL